MDIYSNYSRQCKDTQGGIKKVFLLPFVEYNEIQIQSSGLELTVFPQSKVYEFDVEGNFSHQSTEERGNVSLNQVVTIDMSKVYNFYDVNVFVRNDWRVLVEDNNGNLLMFGTNNGMKASLSNESGTEKGVFNGFRVTFNGLEELTALLVDEFDDFFYVEEPEGSVFNYDLNFDIIG